MNNKGLLAIAGAACLATLSQGALAAKGFSYTYVNGGYQGIWSDPADADGVAFDLSFGATDHFMVLAGYSHLWQDKAEGYSSVDVQIDQFTIGGGGHYSITDRIDLVGSVVYVNEQSTGDAKPKGSSSKNNIKGTREGYQIDFYGRIRAMDKLELNPGLVYRNVGDYSDTGFGLEAVYEFRRDWSVLGNATYFDDDSATNLFVGLRFDM